MIKINLDDVDRLHSICNDLNILVYLQGLVQYDCDSVCNSSFEISTRSVTSYILDRQQEAVLKLKHLLEKDDFLQSSDKNK